MSASDLLRQGGEWLGVARSWLQWHTRNGSRVAWGSNTALEPPLTVRQVEELAAYVAASVYDALTAERAAHERTQETERLLRAHLERIRSWRCRFERLRYSIGIRRRPTSFAGLIRMWWSDFVVHPLFEGEETCEDCGRDYPLWRASDSLWIEAMGDPGGLLCPTCFSDRLEAKGVIVKFRATVFRRQGEFERNPLRVRLYCPWCGRRHIDEGEWATRPHHEHLCRYPDCLKAWRVEPYCSGAAEAELRAPEAGGGE